MASENVRQRIRDEATESTDADNGDRTRRDKKMAMAKRGLRSLTIAVAVPLSLAITNIYLFGSPDRYRTLKKPSSSSWYPSIWALHLACLASTFLMGLSSWLVWADGGFHRGRSALPLYVAQLALCLSWDPLVFALGLSRIGLMVCIALFGVLVGCSRSFGQVNPTAGDLVKPCLLCAAFRMIVNYLLL
ncbi:PREDICTED: translocator protein homolog [Nelumbo nucifera]|uniref:Translocator protein homolog n=2 Tax=Nelumbo nucifera TaxID=4432 RepID=A0A822YVQ1_NELNU|nr:PREDICTED: translocator protein homolog [Nelumbo nucifera]DAD33318.1 TPA_asm: hypothetical protein HUJ06_012169 [Nelumbo nucifera]